MSHNLVVFIMMPRRSERKKLVQVLEGLLIGNLLYPCALKIVVTTVMEAKHQKSKSIDSLESVICENDSIDDELSCLLVLYMAISAQKYLKERHKVLRNKIFVHNIILKL